MKNDNFEKRANKILSTITTAEFLSKKGLGNEIPFYVFDYPPDKELEMRRQIGIIIEHLQKHHSHIKFVHINLFKTMISYLKEIGILEKSFEMELQKGSEKLLNALSARMQPKRFIEALSKQSDFTSVDLILMDGVGSIWPFIRAHSLLNNLQSITGNTSLVLFYPGRYTGQSFKLFDKLKDNNYYRAFRLIP
jgi:hypothetical protein